MADGSNLLTLTPGPRGELDQAEALEAIDALRQRVVDGELDCVAIAAVYANGSMYTTYVGDLWPQTLAAVSWLRHRIETEQIP